MNNIEEQLWAYIDGTCTGQQQQAIRLLIADDSTWREKYEELLALNSEIETLELDEPSMAFTYNVMEGIRAEHAKQPLKAAINTTVIKVIGGFFVFTILALVVFMFASINWSAGVSVHSTPDPIAKLPDFSQLLNGPVVKGFMFLNVVLILFLFDGYLRRRSTSKQA